METGVKVPEHIADLKLVDLVDAHAHNRPQNTHEDVTSLCEREAAESQHLLHVMDPNWEDKPRWNPFN